MHSPGRASRECISPPNRGGQGPWANPQGFAPTKPHMVPMVPVVDQQDSAIPGAQAPWHPPPFDLGFLLVRFYQ